MVGSILSNDDNEDDEVWDETAEGQTITRELALKKCGKLLLQGPTNHLGFCNGFSSKEK